MVTAVSNTTQTTSQSPATGSLATTYETFLALLTAQIKNQDPLSPMDSTEWTNQLVQYTSVEQQLKSNEYLSAIAAQGVGNMANSVSFIGKTAIADIDTQTFKNDPLEWHYELAGDAAKVDLQVLNSSGEVVWSGEGTSKSKGDNSFTWDGKNAAGQAVPPGNYTLKVKAKTAQDAEILSAVSVQGRVTATELIDGEVMLRIGQSLIPLTYVSGVREELDA